jgi:hypothetical protein
LVNVIRTSVLALLIAGIAVQVYLLKLRDPAVQFGDLRGPRRDSLLTTFPVRVLGDTAISDLRALLTARTRCGIAVFMDVQCSICGRMRHSWPREYRQLVNGLGRPINAVWMFGGSPDSVRQFVRGFEDELILLATVTSPSFVIRELGVFGTPITYVVDAEGRFRIGVSGNRVPPVEALAPFCGAQR